MHKSEAEGDCRKKKKKKKGSVIELMLSLSTACDCAELCFTWHTDMMMLM